MSEYEELQKNIADVLDSVISWGAMTNRYADAVNEQVAKLWEDNAELRDELHALANRIETLTRARLVEPAEVAAKIIEARPGLWRRDDACYPPSASHRVGRSP